jgi:predicted nucleotidyltransferase
MGTIPSSNDPASSAGRTPRAPTRKSLGDALYTKTQQRVLALLFGQTGRSYFFNELVKLTGSGAGAVQRELQRLTDSGLVNSTRIGNQRHFQANPHSPIFGELVGIVSKTFGVAQPLREALQPYEPVIHCAFIFGSVAKQEDTAASDIDLFVVSDSLTNADLINQLLATEVLLTRRINTTLYTRAELIERRLAQNAFVTRTLAQPKIWIIGSESDL